MSNAAISSTLQELATEMVARALRAGASDAEVSVREGDEFSTTVRMGEVETLKESGSRGIGLRVLVAGENGYRVASSSSSDLTPDGLEHLVRGAMALAQVTSEDPFAGLPEPGSFGQLDGDLELYFDDVYSLPTEERIAYAKRAEAASLAGDARLVNSDGASFDAATGRMAFANSRGFAGEYRSSYCSVVASPIAQGKDGEMQRDYWYSNARSLAKLDSPEEVGRIAAERTLRMLDARRVKTQQAPVVFAPELAGGLVGAIFDAVSGDAVWRGASFLAGKLGETIAVPGLTVVDDGTIPGGFGTRPFDGEGLPTRRNVLVENGVLKSYVLHSYTARKLKMQSTGNAGRGLAGNPYTASHNLFMEAGTTTPEEILRQVGTGFYVTRLMGRGVNMVTGDYSRGAAGLWIENGELAFPVQEVTVAGNLKDMLQNISAMGNDLVFRSSTSAPTLRVDGMTISGRD
ncbi:MULTISPECIES: metallopeptidase TldD-related protein [Acidobacterium]|uniref:TldD/PmbA family protein n=1 Tax=Acidobacterium capsulatum (strain ATCC 51196 / DSM 11244 / BCRC 80197 / JCM 7670 / NBRC 15755 / NCIMB 13165 / 161) TaxID=240015 RepID=C1F2G5_ACIC5|nr:MULTISPECIES: metallopeptidase TldD-related protein [Acidobacterium]ACO34404.1 TldD/PmbA family protein [Acidobacterium capsulatum ATCC 51196]HCT60685.1 peptidase [Acidobacterium sp.]